MSLKIFSFPHNYRVWKAQIAANYGNVDVEILDNKSPDFKGKGITDKVPLLQTRFGFLNESNAIARYISRLGPEAGLLGGSFFEQGQIDQWIDFSANSLEAPRAVWIYPVKNIMAFDGQAYSGAKKQVSAALKTLNNHLLNHTFLVGNSVTLADITIVSALVDMYRMVLAPGYMRQFPNVTRWFTTCINQAEFKQVIGEVVFTKKEQQAPKPAKKAAPKKEKKKQQQQAPKPKPKKVKNPLLLLPKSKMHLDTVKKSFFSCKPFKKDFFDNFWSEVFDPAGYSIYFADYNYNDENKVQFMTANLMNGWLQRLEPLRKWGFGVVMIVGEEGKPPFKITACWMFRGQDVPFEMKDAPDTEYYTFTKADVADKATQQKIQEYYEDRIGGKESLELVYFK